MATSGVGPLRGRNRVMVMVMVKVRVTVIVRGLVTVGTVSIGIEARLVKLGRTTSHTAMAGL